MPLVNGSLISRSDDILGSKRPTFRKKRFHMYHGPHRDMYSGALLPRLLEYTRGSHLIPSCTLGSFRPQTPGWVARPSGRAVWPLGRAVQSPGSTWAAMLTRFAWFC